MALLCAASTAVHADIVSDVHRRMHRQMQEEQSDAQLFQALVDSLTNQNEEDESTFELYPSLDLYTDWDDAHVDPLRGKTGISIPDTMAIDMSHFYAPIVGKINSPYGWRRRRMHKGVDIKLYTGDTIRAAFAGRVRIKKFDRRGYGYYYVIRHSNGLETVYGHLSKFIVDKDDYVKAGDPIGLGGSTGRSTGPHLHLEFRVMGIALNPADLIDFNTFTPKQNPYIFRSKKAKLEQEGLAGSGEAAYHRVKSGDTLGGIARKYHTSVSRLCKLNNIRSTTTLRIGQRIRYK
ncbi:MAG: peptidoglycan DD-metalloendopeptidase family protein [Bacteroidales bacterium]|nr:peptidoglycan DD-metalloendopeptidase family protein [Candidatus Liminaster caballi]